MDKISILGLLIGFAAIVGGQVLEGGNVGALVQPTAFLIVVGGTVAAVLLQTPFSILRRSLQMLRWILVPPVIEQKKMIEQMVQWSHQSRREGLLALENSIQQLNDEFSRRGLQLLVDGADPQRIHELLEIEIDAYEDLLRQSARVWDAAGGYSPTIGILGAVMGLIHVMENLSDPTKLGAGIAVAFVATIYGVALANLVYLPIAGKLKYHIGRLVNFREMVVAGLVGIAGGDNPRIIESRLRGYVV